MTTTEEIQAILRDAGGLKITRLHKSWMKAAKGNREALNYIALLARACPALEVVFAQFEKGHGAVARGKSALTSPSKPDSPWSKIRVNGGTPVSGGLPSLGKRR